MSKGIMSVTDIHKALRLRHPSPAWVYFAEMRSQTGFAPAHTSERYLDGFAMGCWESTKLRRVAYEIKITRSDWLNELKNPLKRQFALAISHEFWFALAPGVTKISYEFGERPVGRWPDWEGREAFDLRGCGVLEVQDDRVCKVLRRAASRRAWPMPESFIASLLRRVDVEPTENGSRNTAEPLFRTMELGFPG